MSEEEIIARTGLEAVAASGRRGRLSGPAGVWLTQRPGVEMAGVAARRGMDDAVRERLRAGFGLEAPLVARCAVAGPLAIVWSGPGQWLVMSDGDSGGSLSDRLALELTGLAGVCELSDARVVIRIGGQMARETLAKGLPIDLDPRVFGPGHAASTMIGHISVLLWQVDERPCFDIAVGRSFAESLWAFLDAAGAEFGVDIAPE